MSQSHIILVRHGEASAKWSVHPNPGLSELGHEQAKDAGRLIKEKISSYQLLSSPKKRAVETMEAMSEEKKYNFQIDSIFTEIPSSKINVKQKQEWLKEIFIAPIEALPKDVKEWRNNLINWLKSANGNFIVTTHFMVINSLVSYITKNNKISCFHPDYVSRTELFIKDGELTQLILGDDKKTVINL
jgi:probable phosphoglycerate mutase